MNVATATIRYLDSRRHELRPNTIGRYRRLGLQFASHVGADRDVTTLAPRHVESWICDQRHLSPATIRVSWSWTRGFCAWLHDHDINRRPLMRGIRPPRTPKPAPRAIAASDVSRLLAHAPQRERLIVLLMVHCGLRCCEVASVEMGDIDWQSRLVTVTGKGGHMRVLPLPGELWAELEQVRYAAGPLIRSESNPTRGITPGYVSHLIGRLFRDAGVRGSAHALRHTMATDCLDRSGELRHVQAALGHASIVTTERYVGRLRAAHELRGLMDGRVYA